MSLAAFALPRYLLVLLLCAAAYPIGRAILRRLTFENLAEDLSICTTMGLGILSHLVLIIGCAGWLNAVVIPFSIAVAVAASFWFLPKRGARVGQHDQTLSPRPLRIVLLLGCVVAAVLFARAFLLPLYPPTEFDVTEYHLAAPKMWLQAHAIIPTPFLRYQVGPSSAHALFAALMLAHDDLAPQILSFAAIGLVATLLYGWGKRANTACAGILAAALWIGSPAVLDSGPVASYHALAGLFASASIYTLAAYVRTRQLTWLFAAAALMGFAQSTWSGTFYFVPVFAMAAAYFTFRERRSAPLLAVTAGFLLGWGPTLLRSAWYTGNPTYPLFAQLFGSGPWWTLDDFGLIALHIQSFGVARTLKSFLALPYTLLASPGIFQSEHSYSLVLFALLPIVGLRAICDKLVRWLLALLLFYVACWFLVGQVMRYLLPIVPVLCLAVALTICWLLDWICGRKRANLRCVVTSIAAILIVLPSARSVWKTMVQRGAVPLTLDQKVAYIAERIPAYKAVAVANAAPAPLYALFAINCAYYADGLFMGDYFGPGRYSLVIDNLANAGALYGALHRLGAAYFLVDRPHLADRPHPNHPDQVVPPLPYGQEFDARFELIYADSSTEIYRILELPVEPGSQRPNLLNDAGFDELEGNFPTAWNRRGVPVVATPPGGAASGEIAVQASETDGFQQFVKIVPREIYELQVQARADARGRAFRLQVNWIDGQGKICDVFIRVIDATPSWHPYTARLTAPERAERAEVYVSGHGTDWVWLDSFAFRDIGARSPQPKY
jgi:hypothetical protein